MTPLRTTVERIVSTPELPDLSLRQIAVLLFVRDEPKAECTIRGMAAHLCLHKPAITRAADRLQELGYATRQVDRSDRRNVFVRVQPAGLIFLDALLSADTTAEAA